MVVVAIVLKPRFAVLATLDAHDEVQTLAISDFDTAKTVTKSQQAKTVIGTPSYMAYAPQHLAPHKFFLIPVFVQPGSHLVTKSRPVRL
jgi:hypothetical protein